MTQPGIPSRRIADVVESIKFPKDAWYALEVYRSYPIPVRTKSGVALAFLFGNQTTVPLQGRWYSPPARLALVDPTSGVVDEVRTVTPVDFGRPTPDSVFNDRLPTLTKEAAVERPRLRRVLYDAYDSLLPAFAANRTQLTATEREAAERYREAFATLAEPPLRPYYAFTGHEFSAWLARSG